MANNNNYNSYNNQRQPSRGGFTPTPAAPVVAKAIPENYVDLAETLMSANSKSITTSKLRNWFSIVKDFVTSANLLSYIKGIGESREQMIRFAQYMEALVAYHKYFGGKEA